MDDTSGMRPVDQRCVLTFVVDVGYEERDHTKCLNSLSRVAEAAENAIMEAFVTEGFPAMVIRTAISAEGDALEAP
jgi:hypothetical protein